MSEKLIYFPVFQLSNARWGVEIAEEGVCILCIDERDAQTITSIPELILRVEMGMGQTQELERARDLLMKYGSSFGSRHFHHLLEDLASNLYR